MSAIQGQPALQVSLRDRRQSVDSGRIQSLQAALLPSRRKLSFEPTDRYDLDEQLRISERPHGPAFRRPSLRYGTAPAP